MTTLSISYDPLTPIGKMIESEFDFHFNYDTSACNLPDLYIVSGKCHNASAVYNESVLQAGREVISKAGFLVGLVEE